MQDHPRSIVAKQGRALGLLTINMIRLWCAQGSTGLTTRHAKCKGMHAAAGMHALHGIGNAGYMLPRTGRLAFSDPTCIWLFRLVRMLDQCKPPVGLQQEAGGCCLS